MSFFPVRGTLNATRRYRRQPDLSTPFSWSAECVRAASGDRSSPILRRRRASSHPTANAHGDSPTARSGGPGHTGVMGILEIGQNTHAGSEVRMRLAIAGPLAPAVQLHRTSSCWIGRLLSGLARKTLLLAFSDQTHYDRGKRCLVSEIGTLYRGRR